MMKLYRVQVDTSGGGDFIILANSREEAIDFINPEYHGNVRDYFIQVSGYDLDEAGVLIVLD